MTAALPILIRPGEGLDISAAAKHSGRSDKCVRRWIRDHAIACRSLDRGPWVVSAVALEMVMHGDQKALELLREGQRSAPEVQRYVDFLGLPPD